MTCTTPVPTSSGRAKKSLAHQIDRLDAILDGLAEALNGAVADAVKEAVGAAVAETIKVVLTEVLANPELVARLAPASPASPPAPTWRDRHAAAAHRVRGATSSAARWMKRAVARTVTAVAVAAAAV